MAAPDRRDMVPSPAEASDLDRPLAQQINAATRSVHAALNKQIIARLPLALPPHAPDSSAYVAGLLHIAPIYLTFESLWQTITQLSPSDDVSTPTTDGVSSLGKENDAEEKPSQPCPRVHAMLSDLFLPHLMRSGPLKEDIGALTGWSSQVVDEQLGTAAQTGRLGEFLAHIRRAVEQKPHILLAYSYIMFMALFAGGRYIRASLQGAGDDFWNAPCSIAQASPAKCDLDTTSAPECSETQDPCAKDVPTSSATNHDSPFCFFHFSTPNDGEDLKLEFKSKLSKAEENLTEREKREIVQEAVCIFDNMRLLVQQLDVVSAGLTTGDVDSVATIEALSRILKNPLAARFRDSVMVTKERAAKNPSKWLPMTDDKSEKPPSDSNTRPTDGPLPSFSHPPLAGISTGQLCPAMAKSVRFEKTSGAPSALRLRQSSDGLTANFAGGAKRAAQSIYGVGITNLIVACVLGGVFVGLFMQGRGVLSF